MVARGERPLRLPSIPTHRQRIARAEENLSAAMSNGEEIGTRPPPRVLIHSLRRRRHLLGRHRREREGPFVRPVPAEVVAAFAISRDRRP